MFPSRQQGITRLHFIAQHVGVVALFWGVYVVVNWLGYGGRLSAGHYVQGTFLLTAAALVEYFTREKDSRHLAGLSKRRLCAVSHRQTLFALATIFGTMVMSKDDSLSRIVLAVFFSAYFVWISWSNSFGYRLLHRALYCDAQKGLVKALLIGSPAAVNQFWKSPSAPRPPGTDLLGYVPVGGDFAALGIALPQLGEFQDLRSICEVTRAKALLLLGMHDRKDLVSPVTAISHELGLRTMWIDDVNDHFGPDYHPYHTHQYAVVSHLREPLEDPMNRAIKRLFDLTGSAIGILLCLPPAILLVAVLHRLHSPGPLFYFQRRSGRNGGEFNMIKFRSMRVAEQDKFEQATQGDPRVFPGGRFIRKTSIDELPQLINVFLGRMSLVGPRPHPLELDARLVKESRTYRLRHLAKPGITGLAQCRGWRGETRNARQIRNRVRLDIFYIQHWSPWLDIRIVVETIFRMLKPHETAF